MSRRIPSLDGIRAVAISLVIAAHANERGAQWMPDLAKGYLDTLAVNGVKIFFVLSGFLITSILLRELKKSGTISLRQFYWRRSLRIFPAFYVFLGLIAAAYFAGLVNIGADSPWQIFSAAFYVSDYLPIFGWPLHHTWSLSVEERFYLLWPAILLFCGIKRAWLFPSLLIVGATASRMVYVHHFRFDGVADSLAVGCLAAIYRERIEQLMRRLWPRSLPLSALLIFPVLAVPLSNTSLRHVMFAAGAGILIFNVTVGVAMLAAIMQPPAWLNAPPIVWLGRISYSLYLWQQPWVADTRIGWIWLPAAIACAWLSYRFVEQPVLRWRDRMTVTTMHDSSQVARPHLHSSG